MGSSHQEYRETSYKKCSIKPLKGVGSGVSELALAFRGDAYRVVYAVQLGADVWVIHAFQKKSKMGIRTPKQEIDLIEMRLRRIKEMVQ